MWGDGHYVKARDNEIVRCWKINSWRFCGGQILDYRHHVRARLWDGQIPPTYILRFHMTSYI